MQKNIEQQVKNIISNCLPESHGKLTSDALLVDHLYADSLELIDILLSLNDEFGIDMSANSFVHMKTIGDICKGVEQELKRELAT